MKNFLIAIGSMSVMLAAPSAFAGAGRATNVDASGRFAVVRWTQPAGTFATVETTALQGTVPDTVLYVFDEAMPTTVRSSLSQTSRRRRGTASRLFVPTPPRALGPGP